MTFYYFCCILQLTKHDNTSYHKINIPGIRQHVTLYDLNTTDKTKGQQYLVGAQAIWHSVSSTTVKAGDFPWEVRVIEVTLALFIIHKDLQITTVGNFST